MTANWCESSESLARLHKAGISFRFVRSPPAPKITMTQGLACCPCTLSPSFVFIAMWHSWFSIPTRSLGGRRLFEVSAELETHGGQDFSGKIILTARNKALIERC